MGTSFSGVPTHATAPFASGGSGSVTVALAAGTSYHWQYRAADESGAVSLWAPFGANPEPSGIDLQVAGPPPPPPPAGGGGGGGCGATGAEGLVGIGALLLLRRRRPA